MFFHSCPNFVVVHATSAGGSCALATHHERMSRVGPVLDVVPVRDVRLLAQVHGVGQAGAAAGFDAHAQVRAGALGVAQLGDVVDRL